MSHHYPWDEDLFLTGLGLNARARNRLWNMGVRSADDLLKVKESEIIREPGVGVRTWRQIIAVKDALMAQQADPEAILENYATRVNLDGDAIIRLHAGVSAAIIRCVHDLGFRRSMDGESIEVFDTAGTGKTLRTISLASIGVLVATRTA